MKDKLFGYTKDRPLYVNIITTIFCFIGMILIPSIIAVLLMNHFDENVSSIIGDIIFVIILVIIFLRDLHLEAKRYFNDFKNNFKKSFKIYILGFLGMVLCNLFIITILKDISSNETQVREMLYKNIITSLINISILAPILEELVFRKSLSIIFKNKWVFIILSGLLFGSAHILVNVIQGTFVLTDLIYILPYASLGCSFALMDYNNKSVFPSIIIHSIHNTFTAVLLLITYFGGK